MSNVFVIKVFALEDKIRPNFFGPPLFPLRLNNIATELGCNKYFSSRTKALNFLKKKIKEQEKEDIENIVYFGLSAIELDTNISLNYEMFDPNFNLIISCKDLDKPFYGLKKASKYKVGDWIIYTENEQVHCGIIGAVPYSEKEVKKQNIKDLDQYENHYYVLWDNYRNIKDDHAHSHLSEQLILQKLDTVEGYLTSHSVYKLENRFKEYVDYQIKRLKTKDL